MSKATADVKSAALGHAELALATLAAIMKGDSHPAAARVAAANAILDRAYGKPKQSLDVDGSLAFVPPVINIVRDEDPA